MTNWYRSAKAQFLCLEAGQTLRRHLCSRASSRIKLHLGFHLTSRGCLASSLSLSCCPPSLTGHQRKPSSINHIHSNVWLRVCFWKNLLSDALGRLLTLQLCTSLMAIYFWVCSSSSRNSPSRPDCVASQTSPLPLKAQGPPAAWAFCLKQLKGISFLNYYCFLLSFMYVFPFYLLTNHFKYILVEPFYSLG